MYKGCNGAVCNVYCEPIKLAYVEVIEYCLHLYIDKKLQCKNNNWSNVNNIKAIKKSHKIVLMGRTRERACVCTCVRERERKNMLKN